MNFKTYFSGWLRQVDVLFLLFLIGVTSIKLQIKVVVVILYLLFWIFKRVKIKQWFKTPIKFYLLISITGIIGALFSGSYNYKQYWFGSAFGIGVWVICALSFLLLRITVNNIGQEKSKRTIEAFFIVNLIICLIELIKMSVASGQLFPYWYTELSSIYGVSSGDHIYGLFQDNSTVNAAISLLSSIYFLIHKKYRLAIVNIVICLLCTSNITFGLLIISLFVLFLFFQSQRKQIFYTGVICLVMYLIISPENFKYINRVFDKYNFSDNNLTTKEVTNINDSLLDLTTDSINTENFDVNNDRFRNLGHHKSICVNCSFPMKRILNDFSQPIEDNLGSNSLYLKDRIPENLVSLQSVMGKWYGEEFDKFPIFETSKVGKFIYLDNTYRFITSSVPSFLFGAGMGNYSSKLAIKMTGFKLQGSYPLQFRYIGKSYFENTFFVHMFYWAKSLQTRSNINYPGSVYTQIIGEYGIVGFFIFLIFYLGYFIRYAWQKEKKKLALIFVVLMLFFFDYWFEMLSLIVFFELFMIIDLENDCAHLPKFSKRDNNNHS